MSGEEYPLSAKAQAMMIYLIVEANKHREKRTDGKWDFPLYIEVSQQDLMQALNIARRETLYKIRDEMVEAGYLLFLPGIGASSTAYILLPTRPADFAKIRQDKTIAVKLINLVKFDIYRRNNPI